MKRMGIEQGDTRVGKHKSRVDARDNMTMGDLQAAVNTINNFASMYRRATMAIKSLERAQGQAGIAGRGGGMGGMFGGASSDPFTSMMTGAIEQAVQQQATKLVEKKTAGTKLEDSAGGLTEEEMAEAQGGLEGGSEEEEES